MGLFTYIVVAVHIAAILMLMSTMPHQLNQIWGEKDIRHRRVCWLMLLGTLCLMATNAIYPVSIAIYGIGSEAAAYGLTGSFNSLIGIMLAVSAHMLYRSTDKTVTHTIEDIEKDD